MDADLVIRAQGGDREAFERLATASVGRLHAVAWSILRRHSNVSRRREPASRFAARMEARFCRTRRTLEFAGNLARAEARRRLAHA